MASPPIVSSGTRGGFDVWGTRQQSRGFTWQQRKKSTYTDLLEGKQRPPRKATLTFREELRTAAKIQSYKEVQANAGVMSES